jgi:peptide/nickel transport system substrate-binding protein
MHPFRSLTAVVLALGLLGAACGGNDDTAGGGGGGADDNRVARSGGAATVIQPFDAASLDPNAVINSPSQGSSALNAIYDVLFTVDNRGELTPGLATDFSTQDGITWTLTLREDVEFTDGTPFDAEAVKAQWERSAEDPRSSGWSHLQEVASMNVVDPRTLEVVRTTPNRQFHHMVAWTNLVWIPSPTAVAEQGDDFGNHPVGAGPFVLQTRTPNASTVLERNPDYWQDGLPMLDSLTFTTVHDQQQAYDTLVSGGAQAAVNVPDQFAAQAEEAGLTLVGTDQVGGSGWLFGTDRPPFDDPRARQAVYLAVDMEDFSESFTNGAGEVARTFFPENSPFYNPDITFPEPDPEEAQRLLDELAADGEPVSFTITVPAGGDAAEMGEYLQTQLSGFDNLEVEVETIDGSTYGTTLYSGDFDLAVYAFLGVDPEPAVASMRSNHPIPIGSMDSPAIDQAVQEGRTAADEAGRRAAYDDLTTALNDEYRMMWMFRNYAWSVEAADVTGITSYGQGSPLWTEFGYAE